MASATTIIAVNATEAAIIRPADARTCAGLRRLAREWPHGRAHIQRGAISLAGATHPAWLALSDDGRLLAAALEASADDSGISGAARQ